MNTGFSSVEKTKNIENESYVPLCRLEITELSDKKANFWGEGCMDTLPITIQRTQAVE